MHKDIFVKMENISKNFGTVRANDAVSFEVRKGEIHALLGENGAGKSTLMNMLSGIYKPDSGFIYIMDKSNFPEPKRIDSNGNRNDSSTCKTRRSTNSER